MGRDMLVHGRALFVEVHSVSWTFCKKPLPTFDGSRSGVLPSYEREHGFGQKKAEQRTLVRRPESWLSN